MKNILLIFVGSLIIRNVIAQDIKISQKDVSYFNDTIFYELKDQLPDGTYKIYYDVLKKNLECTGEILNHQKINKWTWFYETGKKRIEISYENGLYQGQFICYYPDEKQSVSIPYSQGIRNGSTAGWYPNGLKLFEGSYTDGNASGDWKFYNEDGTLFKEEKR